MRRRRNPLRDLNPTLRGFLIIIGIVLVVVVLQLYQTIAALYVLARIAFLLAIAFFLYLVWRERRQEISVWPARARAAFYGAAFLILADIFFYSLQGAAGLEAVAFLLVLPVCGYTMWRVWREQRTYGY
jgi:ABC-type nickel/cobalt efflux system permease component RcnA